MYVPGLTQNLLSVGQLIRKEYVVKFDSNYCIIDRRDNQLVAKVQMSLNKVFPLIMPAKEEQDLQVEKINESFLWHWSYGHLNYRTLKVPKEKIFVIHLSKMKKMSVCEGCISGKLHRLLFTKSSWRAKALLESVVQISVDELKLHQLIKKIFSTFCR